MMWTLPQAQALVHILFEEVYTLDYHLALGGSVLHDGESDHDLDLYFLPLNGYKPGTGALYDHLLKVFKPLTPLRDSPDYKAGEPWHCKEALQGKYLRKRVDLFIW